MERQRRGAGLALDLVEIGYVAEDGVEQRVSLADSPGVAFESCAPVRRFPSRKGQRHLPGRGWSATMAAHVGYESWLERDHLMLLYDDPDVDAIASQPFWLLQTPAEGRAVERHEMRSTVVFTAGLGHTRRITSPAARMGLRW